MRRHNEEMKNRAEHYNVYLDELTRRETVRQGERMEALTTSLKRLTWWIVVLTVIIVIATVVGVLLTTLTLTLGGSLATCLIPCPASKLAYLEGIEASKDKEVQG
jgi:uncharacterized membrane protein